jgi:hypothetical protein
MMQTDTTIATSQTRRMARIVAVSALLVGLWVAAPTSQTGQVMPPPKFTAYDGNGDPCNGCKLFAYAAGTTTKQDTYTSSALGTPNANPVVLDSAGRATVFVSPTLSYKFVLAPASDTDPPAAPIWTVDNVVGPFSGVVSVTAANTRGVQISRAGAEAGLSIASTGGSGKTYGIASGTTGAFVIRDDSDGTPNLTISGDIISGNATTINLNASGNVNASNGLTAGGILTAAGASTLTGAVSLGSTLAVTGVSTFSDNIITSQSIPRITMIETDGSANNKRWAFAAELENLTLQVVNDAVSVGTTVWDVDRTGTTVDAFNLKATATTNTGRYNSATAQPGFLAYNSVLDQVATGGTADFDTEVYDDGGNFSADTFTAPVTGRYQLCTTVTFSDNSASSYGLRIVTTARTYQVDTSLATSAGVSSACVYADMAASATASIQVLTGDIDIDIEGGASPMVTYFSGRLVP